MKTSRSFLVRKQNKVQKATLLNEPGDQQRLFLLPNGKTLKTNPNDLVLEVVPDSQIPKFWKETLQLNPTAKLAVVYVPHTNPACTQLVCRKTLEPLTSIVRSEEVSEIKLWQNHEIPSEGKPSLVECDTIYQSGEQIVSLPDSPEPY